MATIPEALAIAFEHHKAGRFQPAEGIYRSILEVDPEHVDTLHLLGVLSGQMGKPQVAVEFISKAIRLNDNQAVFHANLGEAYRALGRIPEAKAAFERALQLQPESASVHNNLGLALRAQGHLEEAAASYRRALGLGSDYAEAYCNLGMVAREQGRLDEAVVSLQQALSIKPEYAEAHYYLGVAWKDQRKLGEAAACFQRAIELRPELAEAHDALGSVLADQGLATAATACYRRALNLKPDFAEAHNNLGNVLKFQNLYKEAIASYQRAIELRPDFAEAHNNLGLALHGQGQLDQATLCYQRAIQLNPDCAAAYNNRGLALQEQGRLAEAVAAYRQALQITPNDAATHSNLLFTLVFCPDIEAQTILNEHRKWNQLHAEPLAEFIQPPGNDRSPKRRLRIGYVSPDLRSHPVGRWLLPLLENHDHVHFEIHCYSSTCHADSITERFRNHADQWRDVFGLSDDQLAQIIRQDQIDILVDITMHMAGNRLLAFARKPAPVQVTYLAYPGTTGLSTMDYRLTDGYMDPPTQRERYYSEESIRLPEICACFRPMEGIPSVNPLPALEAGHVTFGCLNNFCKVTASSLTMWSHLLQALPRSRLLLHAHAGRHRDQARDFLAEHDISPDRVAFVGQAPPLKYYEIYHGVDVALDTFPYTGGTTTCDALWMGVPVVSLVGERAMSRQGLTILANVGLAELVANDSEQYVRIAIELANDLPRLSRLRKEMRERMQSSPLMDAPRFAGHVEAAYRHMWRQWCAKVV